MKILVLNGSPKGKHSTTLQTARYLQALHPEHRFAVLPVGQHIRRYEQDFSPARKALAGADVVLFCYPVYTFLVPYQLQRFLELVRADGVDLTGKIATQITTSKHFYDVTAHRFVEETCFDLGMRVVRGLSADMEDLLSQKGQEEARMVFQQLLFTCAHGGFLPPPPARPARAPAAYQPTLPQAEKRPGKEVVIVTCCGEEAPTLANMVQDFQAALPYPSRVVNLQDFPFRGGCLGCLRCAVTGKCIYPDGFDDFLRTQIQQADAIVYAFPIVNHYTHAVFKCYDDRQFCNGHRTVTQGTPVAYLLQGDYRHEPNLQMVLEGRSEVGGNYLCGVVTDEGEDISAAIQSLADNLTFAMEHHLRRPANFYGVGGSKIFRDLIYLMQGLMKADHQFYKAHGAYDFPQKQKGRLLQMKLVGGLMAIPALQKKMGAQMSRYIIAPYEKVIAQAQAEAKKDDGQ